MLSEGHSQFYFFAHMVKVIHRPVYRRIRCWGVCSPGSSLPSSCPYLCTTRVVGHHAGGWGWGQDTQSFLVRYRVKGENHCGCVGELTVVSILEEGCLRIV